MNTNRDKLISMVRKINEVGVSNLRDYVHKNHKSQDFNKSMDIIRYSAKYGYSACITRFGVSRQYAEQCLKRYYEYALLISKECEPIE